MSLLIETDEDIALEYIMFAKTHTIHRLYISIVLTCKSLWIKVSAKLLNVNDNVMLKAFRRI